MSLSLPDRTSNGQGKRVYCRLENRKFEREDYETKADFFGQNSACAIGHPAIYKLLWDDCVLTKLTGTGRASSMTRTSQVRLMKSMMSG
jgi:hypothetical protein